jgi:hypothetical protein
MVEGTKGSHCLLRCTPQTLPGRRRADPGNTYCRTGRIVARRQVRAPQADRHRGAAFTDIGAQAQRDPKCSTETKNPITALDRARTAPFVRVISSIAVRYVTSCFLCRRSTSRLSTFFLEHAAELGCDHRRDVDSAGCIPATPGRAVVRGIEPRTRVSPGSGFHPLHRSASPPDPGDRIGGIG